MNTKFYSPLKSMLLLGVFLLSTLLTLAQDRRVTGKVTGADGQGIPGVSILLKGTQTGTTTDAGGNFAIGLKSGKDVLVFSAIGYKGSEVSVGSQTSVNVTLSDDVSALDEVVVTGYQTVRKRDITGAVTVVNTEDLKAVKNTSFIQNLAGQASGLNISTSGSPGDATNVRIRGISSFTNNDPLYVIDGVPVEDKFQNTINPNDIETIQVLKDASASSIYGSRASNGVIVITTRQGKSGKAKVSFNSSFGLANAVKGYDEVLNTSSEYYAQAIRLKFQADAANTPWYAKTPGALSQYIQNSPALINGVSNYDPSTYDPLNNQITETNKTGTNWWKEITRTAKVIDQSLNVTGGNDVANYNISASYLNQEGILNLTQFNRATIRANSSFKIGKRLRVGENIMYAANWGVGISSRGGNNNEFGVIGEVIKSTPVVPVYDIKGGPAGHLSAQSGNFTNPTQVLIDNSNNNDTGKRLLGNIFGEFEIIDGLKFRTNLGADIGTTWRRSFTYPQPYRAEGVKTLAGSIFNESWTQTTTWNITNTLQFNRNFGKHSVGILAGQEAVATDYRDIFGQLAGYFTADINAWYLNTALGDPASRSVSSTGYESKLASYFGKVDYAFDDKYLISATIRRDGSSKFLSSVRYGVFPALSLGWRISQEGFMKDLTFISDLKLRASYGELGNQRIRNYNFASIYGGAVGTTFYDINGANGSAATGYSLQSFGNPDTQWETSKNKNFGFDASFINNTLNVVLDIYSRNTENLLYNPALPGTAGVASPPFINVGSMLNTGWDLSINYRKNIAKDLSLNLGMNLSHYRNEIQKVSNNANFFYPSDGTALNSRIPGSTTSIINKVGYPISSFNGYIVEGLITTDAELKKHTGTGAAAIGGLKFKDVNGDGVINENDITVNGNPHPSLTGGLNIGLKYKNFDFNSFWFGSFGNQIFTGYWIQSYFMNFNANVLKDILEKQGTGNYPKINQVDRSSANASTFYIQDGTYVRMTNLQLGYTLPSNLLSKAGISKARVYIQGQNLLTFTGYIGADPAISNANIGSDRNNPVNDNAMGFDNGNYPSNKVFNIGLNLEF
ncbi:TonB-linked SusC/RagA family outer membrane protein [Arcicella aurantiaca]|uniref:TonB-linked SusC/RagA family outer membrane protein n=1 Tax=Arcicella aurantiaca TaxID=591202 RepID=A0A316E1G8_9BACT|nr:TonB-dependent receptor [Arcicella aurantiaca]PWK23382.1 TonB-linked SusC/RagA family outer membrane protein [Arcicella aurantiaca]